MNKVSYGAWGATIIWIGIIGWVTYSKRTEFAGMEPNAIGDFLAGTVSPLALIWLVAGYLQQGKELRLNTEALQAQLKELALQVESTKVIADSSRQQADISREMHDFNLIQTEKKQRFESDRRRQLIKPDIYLVRMQSNSAQWVVTAKNKGGDAFRINVTSKHFKNIEFVGAAERFLGGESRTVHLLGQLPFSNEPFVTVTCWNEDEEQYIFHYLFDESNSSIVSANPNTNGVLVEIE